MTTAVRPPEYLPDLAYMALIQDVECFVLADTFQYSRQSLQNRARLRTPQGWHWISVPLKGGQHGTPVRNVTIEAREPWGRKHWRSFEYNYGTAPFFPHYADAFRALFSRNWDRLGDATCAAVELLVQLFNLQTSVVRASALARTPTSLTDVLDVLGTRSLVVPEEAAPHDAMLVPSLDVLSYAHPTYRQNFDGFVPGMSSVDLLFNYGPEAPAILKQGVHSTRLSGSP